MMKEEEEEMTQKWWKQIKKETYEVSCEDGGTRVNACTPYLLQTHTHIPNTDINSQQSTKFLLL